MFTERKYLSNDEIEMIFEKQIIEKELEVYDLWEPNVYALSATVLSTANATANPGTTATV